MGCVDRMRRKKIMGGNQRKGRSEGDGTNPTRIGNPPSRLSGTVIHVVIISLYYRKVPYTSTQLIIQHIGVIGLTGQFVLHEPCHYIVSCIIILIYLARSHYCRSISIYKGLYVGHVKRRKNKNPYRILPVVSNRHVSIWGAGRTTWEMVAFYWIWGAGRTTSPKSARPGCRFWTSPPQSTKDGKQERQTICKPKKECLFCI